MTRFLTAGIAGAALLAGAAHAQTNAVPTAVDELLVRVDVSDIAEPLATHMKVAADTLPRSVETTLAVAAEVCEVTEDQLRQVRAVEQHVECKATVVSEDLSAATQAEMEREPQQ